MIVGARELWPVPAVASAVLNIMVTHEGNVFCIRANRASEITSGTEDLVDKIGARLNAVVLPWTAAGGSSFHRDEEMVASATEVHAFFAPGAVMEGGTGHVAQVALRLGKALTAYTLNDDGDVVVIGEDEGVVLAGN